MGRRKLQVNSLRAIGMKATIQRFNEARRSRKSENESLRKRGTMRDCEAWNTRTGEDKKAFYSAAILRMLFLLRDDGCEYIKRSALNCCSCIKKKWLLLRENSFSAFSNYEWISYLGNIDDKKKKKRNNWDSLNIHWDSECIQVFRLCLRNGGILDDVRTLIPQMALHI